MIELEQIFSYKKLNEQKLAEAGFCLENGTYSKKFDIKGGEFSLKVEINGDKIDYTVTETAFGEEYALVKTNAVGGFVAEIRAECAKILEKIAAECFEEQTFKTEQAKRLVRHIAEKYSVEPEFLWDAYPDFAVFRHKENEKWFAIIMNIKKEKLNLKGSGEINIVNFKDAPEEILARLDGERYLKAYHMNKKHWYTVCLDGRVSDEEVFACAEMSYKITESR